MVYYRRMRGGPISEDSLICVLVVLVHYIIWTSFSLEAWTSSPEIEFEPAVCQLIAAYPENDS